MDIARITPRPRTRFTPVLPALAVVMLAACAAPAPQALQDEQTVEPLVSTVAEARPVDLPPPEDRTTEDGAATDRAMADRPADVGTPEAWPAIEAGRTSAAPEPRRDALDGTAWRLTMLGAEPVAHGSTLRFADGAFEGEGPCNPYAGAYATSGETIDFREILITTSACPGLDEENAWMRALGATARADHNEGVLMLIGRDGVMVAMLERL